MHIDASNPLPPLPERIRKVGGSRTTVRDAASFSDTQALRDRLDQTPEVRPEAVARGRALIASESYPPDCAIRGIAALLAANPSFEGRE